MTRQLKQNSDPVKILKVFSISYTVYAGDQQTWLSLVEFKLWELPILEFVIIIKNKGRPAVHVKIVNIPHLELQIVKHY